MISATEYTLQNRKANKARGGSISSTVAVTRPPRIEQMLLYSYEVNNVYGCTSEVYMDSNEYCSSFLRDHLVPYE